MPDRSAIVERITKETQITVELNLDGQGMTDFSTGIGFFDHMLSGFARHGLFDLKVKVNGDLDVDCHHTIEDTGIVLGQAIQKALGEKKGIKRYGHFLLPMDESMSTQQRRNIRKLREDMEIRYFDAPDLQDVGRNVYRFINAVSDFATHANPLRKTVNYKENLFSRTVDGNPLIDKAYQMVSVA